MPTTRPKPFVFVLMPFSDEFDDVYKLGIKPACENVGAYAERVDEQIFQESILQRIYNQISKADIIVADMTDRNPNVFYETGYAHALGKKVILLTQNVDHIPFDLKHYPHIVYGGKIIELIPQLEKRVRWAIENPESPLSSFEPDIKLYVNGMSMLEDPTVPIPCGTAFTTRAVAFRIDAQHQFLSTLETISFKLAIITSKIFSLCFSTRGQRFHTVELREGGFVHLPDTVFSLFPGDWKSISIELTARSHLRIGDKEEILIRVLSEKAVHDYPLSIRIVKSD